MTKPQFGTDRRAHPLVAVPHLGELTTLGQIMRLEQGQLEALFTDQTRAADIHAHWDRLAKTHTEEVLLLIVRIAKNTTKSPGKVGLVFTTADNPPEKDPALVSLFFDTAGKKGNEGIIGPISDAEVQGQAPGSK